MAEPALHHSVQFYESVGFLCETVAEFFVEGFSQGEPAVAILRSDRRDALLSCLRSKGVEVDHLANTGQLAVLDAAGTLARIMVGDMPDSDAFNTVIGGTLKNSVARSPAARVRAYGEMVDILWTGGNGKAAIRLEELWSEIQKVHAFSLLCAYVMGNFYKGDDVSRICAAHSRVLPIEKSLEAENGKTFRALAAEIAQRAEVEKTLRESIADLRRIEMRLRRSQWETARLVKITASLADAVTPDEVSEAMVDEVAAALGASTAGLWVVREGERTATLMRSVGYSEETKEAFASASLDSTVRTPSLDVLTTGRHVWIASRDELLDRYPHLASAVKMDGDYRIACLPIAVRGRIAGTVGFTFSDAPPLDEAEESFLMHVARHSGQALERLLLLEADQQARVRAETLYRLAASVIEAGGVHPVFEAALDAIGQGLQATRAAVLVYDAEGVMRFTAWRGLSDEYRRTVEGHCPWTRDARAPEPIFVPDVERDPSMAAFLPAFRGEHIGAVGFIPLVASGRLVGKFMVYYDRPRTLASHELSMARAIANHVAAAIDRFRAVDELQETVRFNEMFTAILGHDLRNPLGAIMTAAQLLLKRDEGDKLRTPLSRIVRSGERMANMIDQLLDFTRVRVGAGIPLQTKRVDIVPLLRQVLDELDDANPEYILRLEHDGITAGVWDGDRLGQVFSNLVGNAIQHGTAGPGVRVRVNGCAKEVVRVEIQNAGAIPSDLLPKLFQPMVGGEPRREKSQGLGLGLFITQEIVKAHRGSIEVRSAHEEGTLFTVFLPRVVDVGVDGVDRVEGGRDSS